MLPTRFLQPREILEMDIHDMGARLEAENKHLLVVGKESQQIPVRLSTTQQDAENVAKNFVELLLTFGIPLSLRSDPGTEFTTEVVQHLCK